jgi:hypothetical protein
MDVGVREPCLRENRPRATLGDSVEEPLWEQQLTISVGQDQSGAEINGTNKKAIQAAVDYVARLGGETVKNLPGTYRLSNAVYLQSNLRLLGSGTDTVLKQEPSVTTTLAKDRIENNRLVNNGSDAGFAIDNQGGTEAIVLSGNEVKDTRGSANRTAIRLGPNMCAITLAINRLDGIPPRHQRDAKKRSET